MEQAKKKAYRELQEATAAQKAAQQAWNDAEFGFETGIADENDVRKAKKALEQAEEKLKMATARYEAANRANALENVKQNAKVQALIAKAADEAYAELTKLREARSEELQTIERIKEQYLEAVKRFSDIKDAISKVQKRIRRTNEIIPNAIPSRPLSAQRQVPVEPWELTIEKETINKYLRSKQSR